MCGRYTITDPEKLEERFDAEFEEPLFAHFNAAPSQKLPVITGEEPGKIKVMTWGFIPPWDKNSSKRIINARGETAAKKKTFKKALRESRCLVLADGFYEWKRGNDKVPYWIGLKEGTPFALAGIIRMSEEEEGKLPTFAILTTTANQVVSPIHKRMPVILSRDVERDWLSTDTPVESCVEMLSPYPDEHMQAYAISKRVNSPANNDPSPLQPVEDQ